MFLCTVTMNVTHVIILCLLKLTWPQASERNLQPLDVHAGWDVANTNVGSNIISKWICEVILQVLNWALSGGLGLESESSKSNHGQAPILDLSRLHCLHVSLSKSKGIKHASWISWLWVWNGVILENRICVHGSMLTDVLPAANLNPMHEEEFPGQQSSEVHLTPHFDGWEVFGETRRVPPLLWAHNLLGQDSCNSEHGPSCVDQLGSPIPVQGLWVSSKTDWIETAIACEGPIKIGGWLHPRGPKRTVSCSGDNATASWASSWTRNLHV